MLPSELREVPLKEGGLGVVSSGEEGERDVQEALRTGPKQPLTRV